MDVYNFLSPDLLPKVHTSCAAMDEYEVTNLIHSNALVKSRGFLAYTSMKPPVDIDFELICPIRLSHINIGTTIGSQRTTGVEILAGPCKTDLSSIAYCTFDNPGVVFCNSKLYSEKKPPPKVSTAYKKAYFRQNMFRAFINAGFVRVRIVRTDRTVPCLGSVEIWGQLSRTCSAATVATVKRLLAGKRGATRLVEAPVKVVEVRDFEVPEDFRDALTLEIMAIPMTLPSGNTIDQSSLEKCTENDAIYGRRRYDPFTGLPFTDTRKPQLNVALKNRIDLFLLQNAHRVELAGTARTCGRKRLQAQEEVVQVNYTASSSKKIKVDGDNLDDLIASVRNSESFHCFTSDESKTDKRETDECSVCSLAENLYKVACKHLLCRKCLFSSMNNMKCGFCDRTFCRREVAKYNS